MPDFKGQFVLEMRVPHIFFILRTLELCIEHSCIVRTFEIQPSEFYGFAAFRRRCFEIGTTYALNQMNNKETRAENIMSSYTLNVPDLAVEALKTGIGKIDTLIKELPLAAKTTLMFIGGPLIGLAFVMALPVISVTLAAYYSASFIATRWTGVARHVKNVSLFLATPFIGLAYVLAFPFVGLGIALYCGMKAARH
jgi:hypothetical protein